MMVTLLTTGEMKSSSDCLHSLLNVLELQMSGIKRQKILLCDCECDKAQLSDKMCLDYLRTAS